MAQSHLMARGRGHTLTLDRVSQMFGTTRALEQVSLEIVPGELIALLGPSGCGKTTLLRIIAGFNRPTTGEVRVDGERIDHVPANRRNVGIVFQNYALFPHLSVYENVAYGLRARKTAPDKILNQVTEMLALVKMADYVDRLPGQLSGGQQQRVALARALAIEPRIVLLDEPFSALDKNLRLDMQIEIKGLLKSYGVTSIIVTHDQEEALSMADRIVVMSKGRIEQVDSPEGLYDRPASLFVNQFVGHTNLIRGKLVNPARAALRAGIEFDLPAAVPGVGVGADVLVSIRPEHFAIAAPGTAGAIAATVRLTLPLGPVEVVEAVTASGEALKINRPRSPATPGMRPGEAVGLVITGTIGVFPAPPP